ncbi:MAG TPA: DinB family protein [Chthonomonadaceae bacterium]|nr:DinB family protein [Chthonomonadaceae bacterium]
MNATRPDLHPTLHRAYAAFAEIRREAEALAGGLTPAQWNWSPAPDQWSLAQILDHLNKTGHQVLPRFETALESLRAQNLRSDAPFRYSLVDRWFLRILRPNPPMKVPVPAIFVPNADPAALTDTLPTFLALQDKLLQFVEAANGFDLGRVKVPSPVSPLVRLSLGAYLEGTAGHEQYHWLQARALRAHPNFPA